MKLWSVISTGAEGRATKAPTQVISTDFEGLVAPHHETDLLGFFVLKQTSVSGSSFLPLICLRDEPEQFGATGEEVR